LNNYFAGKKKAKAKVEDEHPEEEVAEVSDAEVEAAELLGSLLMGASAPEEKPKVQMISMYGEVDEEKIGEIAYALRVLSALNVHSRAKFEPSEENAEFEPDPVELILSTHGGSAADMFSLYDTMRWCREEGTPVATTGIGKIMSAGVLLMAAGTKGKRKIGENCRVMLHGVASGHVGQIHNLENELDEAKWTQDRYVKALVKETNMTERYIKKLFDRRQNVYLTAEEAVELGIADEVF
jgi:ATP-dependent Clp endopeptidase proteolytic subunit ClpP